MSFIFGLPDRAVFDLFCFLQRQFGVRADFFDSVADKSCSEMSCFGSGSLASRRSL
jgi:hypothetical protein